LYHTRSRSEPWRRKNGIVVCVTHICFRPKIISIRSLSFNKTIFFTLTTNTHGSKREIRLILKEIYNSHIVSHVSFCPALPIYPTSCIVPAMGCTSSKEPSYGMDDNSRIAGSERKYHGSYKTQHPARHAANHHHHHHAGASGGAASAAMLGAAAS
jgi:hypothetical protein